MSQAGNRVSTYSNFSAVSRNGPQSTQVSTQTLLNALHTSYSAHKPYVLDSSTSLVVNTWATANAEDSEGHVSGTVDVELARRAWEHARRRAEDGCIVLASMHESSPSLFRPFISSLPLNIPSIFYEALGAIQPFLHCVTPQNPSAARYISLAATFTISVAGNLVGANLQLSTSGIDVSQGLINLPTTSGYRAFDVFYYLLSAASTPAERENLGLRSPSSYSLLNKTNTYAPPAFLPTADDAAAAEELKANLKAIGITGSSRRDLLSALAALLKLGDSLGSLVDDESIENACEEVSELLGLDSEVLISNCSSQDREALLGGLYESLVDWVIAQANKSLTEEFVQQKSNIASSDSESVAGILTPLTSDDSGDTVSITVVDIPGLSLGKAAALRIVFDDSEGINAEMKQDGVIVTPPGQSVLEEMKTAVRANEPDLGIHNGYGGHEKQVQKEHREIVLEKVGQEAEDDSFLKRLIYPSPGRGIELGSIGRFDLATILGCSRVWFHLCLHPTDELPEKIALNSSQWSASSPSRQLRSWRLPEWANRRNRHLDFTADFDSAEFCSRYARLGCRDGRDGIESFILERGWSNGEVIIGTERIWIREGAWWEAETMLDMLPEDHQPPMVHNGPYHNGPNNSFTNSGMFGSPFGDNATIQDSRDNLLQRNHSAATHGARSQLGARSIAPTVPQTLRNFSGGDYGLGGKGDDKYNSYSYENELDPEFADPKVVVEQSMTTQRRIWVIMTWATTFWIPSFALRYIGRMKRPDVRMAWREKVLLVLLIFLLNAVIVFYIIAFGRLLCPNLDKAWNVKQLSYHQGDNDFYVAVRGEVYDISKFWRLDHSTISAAPVQSDQMQPLAGQVLDGMFPIPLTAGCPDLVSDNSLTLLSNNSQNWPFTHTSGSTSPFSGTALSNSNWYFDTFLPAMKDYYKGNLVYKRSSVRSDGQNNQHMWFVLHGQIYDLTNYFYTTKYYNSNSSNFLASQLEDMVQKNPGDDITSDFEKWAAADSASASQNLNCLNNEFYIGKTDFRDTARCLVNNYILLGVTIILCSVILVKFLAALQLGPKRRPSPQDKFVICQVPAYTEGEDHLRKGLDSLTALAYDNKRKLICVICDGMIVGGGNDRPTPKIVLDILGVDPKIDPPALPFRSVGQSSEQLNYGKVYSGLYEYEGNVVPYIVVVKVGKESEQTKAKPGNRGKRDSQILLMSFLNRVHHRAPMSPLELEMFHQINNIIGVDPELYEYLFMVDADTMVREDSLTRLVASCSNDAKIAGICGETSLENEDRSWWTMIQVYEYYISHNLAKAFESLFGSVTCLPGCFCMYRLRTADKGKPLIISDKIIEEYSDCNIDTLHKKNLLSLGEDRYLTTLMTKHFPSMSYKFVADAYAQTAAPETWSILLSQRRRWINSTIHNLFELVLLKDMCGFCCFSMRFVVFIDLFGTIILPATCTYLGYLIYTVSTGRAAFPIISIVMLAAVYGLQAIIFIIKRQWQHVGWMIIYLIAFPVYSFILPIYSFWKQDDFSWGNTRIVIGEKGSKQLVAVEDEGFDPRSIPLQRWDDYATTNNLPGRRGLPQTEKSVYGGYDEGYEMDDMRSVYSSAKPASTVLTGFKSQANQMYMPPQSPAPFAQRPTPQHRQSTFSNFSRYTDHPVQADQMGNHGRLMSMGNMSEQALSTMGQNPQLHQQRGSYLQPRSTFTSTDNLMAMPSPPINRAGMRSPFGYSSPSPLQQSVPNFQTSITGYNGEPSDAQIVEAIQACLSAVDLDNVTKKQLKALTEQRLQCQLNADKKAFLDRQIDAELANM